VACLGSGYDFKAEMALGEDSSGLSYDLIMLHYWKDYVHRHRRILAKGGIDLTAVKRARSLPVICSPRPFYALCPKSQGRYLNYCPRSSSIENSSQGLRSWEAVG
jgi:hypothetical protein